MISASYYKQPPISMMLTNLASSLVPNCLCKFTLLESLFNVWIVGQGHVFPLGFLVLKTRIQFPHVTFNLFYTHCSMFMWF